MRRLFGVQGLACAGCARGLEGRLTRLPGVRSAAVHFLTASVLLDWDETRIRPEDLTAAVAAAGYGLIDRHRPAEMAALLSAEMTRLGIRLAVAVVAGMWSMALAIALYVVDLQPDVAWWVALASGVFALPVVFWSGAGFHWMAWRSLRLAAPGMDLLISLGSLGAMALSGMALAQGRSEVWFDTATMLITLLLLGRLVDAATRRSTVAALTAMESAAPDMACVQDGDTTRCLPCADLGPADRVVVDAGAAVTMDGIILHGDTSVDRAVLTGESAPVPRGPGDRVEAGAVNLTQRIVITPDRAHGDRDIDRMGGAIALEIARRGTGTTLADRIGSGLAIAIPVLAAVTSLTLLLVGAGLEQAMLRGLTLLAAACPCALALAAPLAHARAAQVAASLGLRIRNPQAFERLADIRTAIFDKTGTLTAGHPQVTRIDPAPGSSVAEVLALAARAETGVAHPLARAIIAAHGGEAGPGGLRTARGATATDDRGRTICIGTAHAAQGGDTLLEVRRDGTLQGHLALQDIPAPQARVVLDTLRGMGISTLMATGDSAGPARAIGRTLGFSPDTLHAALTPQDKVRLIAASPGPVLFVGDGVNDGPALAAADCGVSVADAHAAAMQTADLVVMRGGLEAILTARALAVRAVSIGRQNIALALIYNAAAIPAAAAGLLTPTGAAVAMLLSSASVALNALRLRESAALSVVK